MKFLSDVIHYVLYSYVHPQVVVQADPDLVALHCQEVGGKDFEICMPKVKDFIRYALYHVRTTPLLRAALPLLIASMVQ